MIFPREIAIFGDFLEKFILTLIFVLKFAFIPMGVYHGKNKSW